MERSKGMGEGTHDLACRKSMRRPSNGTHHVCTGIFQPCAKTLTVTYNSVDTSATSHKSSLELDFDTVHSALYQQSNKKAPGRDSIGVPVITALLTWDSIRITAFVSQCIYLGYYPEEWKVAKGICIPKPGKNSYEQAKSYHIISLLSCLGKLIQKVPTTLITNNIEL
jgi:hypothetical protein